MFHKTDIEKTNSSAQPLKKNNSSTAHALQIFTPSIEITRKSISTNSSVTYSSESNASSVEDNSSNKTSANNSPAYTYENNDSNIESKYSSNNTVGKWLVHDDFLIENEAFNRGFIVFKPLGINDEHQAENDFQDAKVEASAITLKTRKLKFSDLNNLEAPAHAAHNLIYAFAKYSAEEKGLMGSETLYICKNDLPDPQEKAFIQNKYFVLIERSPKNNNIYHLYFKNSANKLQEIKLNSGILYTQLKEMGLGKQNIDNSTTVQLNPEQADFFKKHVSRHLSVYIQNEERAAEAFFPMDEGFYAYPWLSSGTSQGNTIAFTGFDHFVTAGCLPGSSLVGLDQNNNQIHLIKHDIVFFEAQMITRIMFNRNKLNPYNELLMLELEKVAAFMLSTASRNGQKPTLTYHMPHYDYMLFGVELYLRKRMTYDALEEFFTIINTQRKSQTDRIKEIFAKYDIDVVISSPFANLVDPAFLNASPTKGKPLFAAKFLALFDVYPKTPTKLKEEDLVKLCLDRLEKNKFNSQQAEIWADFINAYPRDSINNLEALFKIANAIMLASAAKGRPDFKTCSILDVTEKQIQISYDKIKSKVGEAKDYPGVVNLNYIPTAIPADNYDNVNRGLLFFSFVEHDKAAKLINLLAEPARQNLQTYLKYRPGVDNSAVKPRLLQDVLSKQTSNVNNTANVSNIVYTAPSFGK